MKAMEADDNCHCEEKRRSNPYQTTDGLPRSARNDNCRRLFCCGIFIWFIINLLQGLFVEIHEDEAYYALYGEHLAWGYFDHPPMVGLMTYLSSLLFHGNLGVRFFTVVVSAVTLFLLWKLLDEHQPDSKKVTLFFIIAASGVMFNIYGFVTTTDAFLILFSTLFLLVYRHYLDTPSWKNALLMGLAMACMIYSKYHAFLFLALIVLSNIRLLKDVKFYVACLVALALLSPHIIWQIQADFPSLKYHLMQRNEPFQWSYFLEYLPNQLLIFNPFTLGAAVYVLVKHKTTSLFERGLRFVLVGFFLFFWLMTFRGHVEPHWTIVAVIPIIILLYNNSITDFRLRRYVKYAVLPSLILVVAVRIALLTPLSVPFGFYGKAPHYKAIEQMAGDSPVAFSGSFQQPALYHFFTGKPSTALRSYYDRMTQFDLWQFEQDWWGRRVLIQSQISSLDGSFVSHFQSACRLTTKLIRPEKPMTYAPGDAITMEFVIENPTDHDVAVRHEQLDFGLALLFLETGNLVYALHTDLTTIPAHGACQGTLMAVVPDMISGPNRVMLGISDKISIFGSSENAVAIEIRK